MFKARLAFHYGWSCYEIENMPYDLAIEYHGCIDTLVAERALLDINVNSFSNMEKQSQSKFRKSLQKISNKYKEEKKLSFKDFAAKASKELGFGRNN